MRIYSYFVEDDIVGGVYIIDEEKHKDADERVAQLNKECGRDTDPKQIPPCSMLKS